MEHTHAPFDYFIKYMNFCQSPSSDLLDSTQEYHSSDENYVRFLIKGDHFRKFFGCYVSISRMTKGLKTASHTQSCIKSSMARRVRMLILFL